MTEATKDQYDDMTGPVLSEELAKRELPTTGKVDELRARLREDDERRAQAPTDNPDEAPEGEETDADDVEVPEPREPLRIQPFGVTLTEDQARELTRGTARVRQFTKHVISSTEQKFCAGDQVFVIGDPGSKTYQVLPFGVEISAAPADTEDED